MEADVVAAGSGSVGAAPRPDMAFVELPGERMSLRDVARPTDAMARRLTAAVRQGLPVSAVTSLVDQRLVTPAEADRILLPRRALAHRRTIGTLTPEQSDRVLRVARIVGLAEETFGNRDKAGTWLRRPTTALEGEAPLDLLENEAGAQRVQTLLGRIAHGIAA